MRESLTRMEERDTLSIQEMAERVKGNIGQVIVGKAEVIELALVALLCEGHVLIEDVPGIGKTIQALAAIRRRGFVIPDDVKHLAPYVLTHRIITPQRLSKKSVVSHEMGEIVIARSEAPKQSHHLRG